MTPPFQIHLVTLGVADLSRAAAFYAALGLARRFAEETGVAFFEAGPVVLSLYPRGHLAADAGLADGAAGDGFGGVTLAYNVPKPEAVAEALARARAAGGQVLRPAGPIFWGGTVGYFADPDGHVWEVAHNPFFSFAENGRLVLSGG